MRNVIRRTVTIIAALFLYSWNASSLGTTEDKRASHKHNPDLIVYCYAIFDSLGNNNGIADPGEEIALRITARNVGIDPAYAVGCSLYFCDPYVAILSSPGPSPGDILPNRTALYPPFSMIFSRVVPIEHEVEFAITLFDTLGHYRRSDFFVKAGVPTLHLGEHNIGDIAFTVTCNDTVSGCIDFRSPRDSLGVLPLGSLWAGNSKEFVVDRDYGPNADWLVTSNPDGHLALGATVFSDEDAKAIYNDNGHPSSKGIRVVQDSWSWISSDSIVIQYCISNQGASTIKSLYIGQFMNWNVIDSTLNYGGTDTTLRSVCMWQDTSLLFGVRLLSPARVSNLTLIDNAVYLHPLGHIPDSLKFQFLNGDLSFPTASIPDDYSSLVSTGPFTLTPNDSIIARFVVFAQRNAAVQERKHNEAGPQSVLDQNSPNPFLANTTIGFRVTPPISGTTEVTLSIHDITGRLVRLLLDKEMNPGYYTVDWDGTDRNGRRVPTGLYFSRIMEENTVEIRKLIVIR